MSQSEHKIVFVKLNCMFCRKYLLLNYCFELGTSSNLELALDELYFSHAMNIPLSLSLSLFLSLSLSFFLSSSLSLLISLTFSSNLVPSNIFVREALHLSPRKQAAAGISSSRQPVVRSVNNPRRAHFIQFGCLRQPML